MKRWRLTAGAVPVLLVLLGGCSGAGQPAPAETPAAPATTPQPQTPSASSTPDPQAAALQCPKGDYVLTSVSIRNAKDPASVKGGEVKVGFDAGRYTMIANGEVPIAIKLGQTEGDMVLVGTITGLYSGTGDAESSQLVFTSTRATGEGVLTSNGMKANLPMESVANVIAPQGQLRATCSGGDLSLTGELASLKLTAV